VKLLAHVPIRPNLTGADRIWLQLQVELAASTNRETCVDLAELQAADVIAKEYEAEQAQFNWAQYRGREL
jgi:hypothetical protein